MNNFIKIIELKNGRYKVVELDAETWYQVGRAIKCGSLKEACKEAQEIESEYGISFKFKK